MPLGELIALLAVTAVLVFFVVVYGVVLRKGRALGTRGIVQRSRVTCPKCRHTFDYDWVPGASLSTVRLGRSRYMACPECGRWSVFEVYGTMIARPSGTNPAPAAPPPEAGS